MLFSYPVEATDNNWFHEALFQIVERGIERIQNGEKPQEWPACIPLDARSKLRKRTRLRDLIVAFFSALEAINAVDRDVVLTALRTQNTITPLLAREADTIALEELPETVRKPVGALYDYAFEALTDLGIRDELYEYIYARLPSHICPFCGCEFFASPGRAREDLDHYLLKSKYPFAAAHLQNLAPMGRACNQKYKLVQDILWENHNTRRRAYAPYGGNRYVSISLRGSESFKGNDPTLPLWRIQCEPDIEETRTWMEVFSIRERYVNDVLDPEFKSWLQEFAYCCQAYDFSMETDEQIKDALGRFVTYLASLELQDRSFLKVEVFRMLLEECIAGDRNVLDLMAGVATV